MRVALLALLFAGSAAAQEPLYVSPDPQSTGPRNAVAFDGLVYFLAESPPASGDVQGTWRTDGTVAGTEFISAINWLGRTVEVGGTLYAVGLDAPNDGTTGPQNLYRLDGTTLVPLTAFSGSALIGSDPVESAGRLFFSALPSQNSDDNELYTLDLATDDVTRYDLNTDGGASDPDGSYPRAFATVGQTTYFLADAGGPSDTEGLSLWRAEPGQAPTVVVGGLQPLGASALASTGSTLLLRADDGLYRLDGDALVLVRAFDALYGMTAFDGQIYFGGDASDDDPDVGIELFRTDGTTAELAANILPETFVTGGAPGFLFPHRGQLYFGANTVPEGSRTFLRLLFRFDGTTLEQVPGLDPFAGPSLRTFGTDNPDQFAAYGDGIAFRCGVATVGASALCVVDGASGEVRVVDIDDVDGRIAATNGRLVFPARSAAVGRDLHVYHPAAAPASELPVPVAFGNQRQLEFYRGVGIRLRASSNVTGPGTVAAARFDGAPADASGIPGDTEVRCRWEVTETGGVAFDNGSSSYVEVPLAAFPGCYGPDPSAAVMYWRPTVGAGAFAALMTDTGGFAPRFEGTFGFGEFALASAGATVADGGPEARTLLALVGPNPARGSVTLRAPGASARVVLFDALGRRVAVAWDGPGGDVTVDTSGLAPGLYLARRDGGGTARFSVVR